MPTKQGTIQQRVRKLEEAMPYLEKTAGLDPNYW